MDERGNTPDSTPPQLRPTLWPKGVSGNPSGRPKGGAILTQRLLALTNDGADIAEALVELCMSGKGEVRIAAIKEFHNRCYGPVAEVVDSDAKAPKTLRVVAG